MSGKKIILINPPIYDFTAYDFWLKPYGLLRAGAALRGQASLNLFDFLDRHHPDVASNATTSDEWDRGPFHSTLIPKPALYHDIPRHYRRYGLPRHLFQAFLQDHGPFDVALIQTMMTYWYPGIQEVVSDLRRHHSATKIVLGGVYATLCPKHASGLDVDLVIESDRLAPLWSDLEMTPNDDALPLWDLYDNLPVGVLKLTDGCPFRCTYCSVPQVYPPFAMRPLKQAYRELELLCRLGVRNIALYDDALLFKSEEILLPFLNWVRKRGLRVNFHTPNALNARFLSQQVAQQMVRGGFKTFYLGFESRAYAWQRRTGGKVYAEEFAQAVQHLLAQGVAQHHITAYLIVGHPDSNLQEVELSMQFAHSLGIRLMLAEFSPIPGTPDGERCRQWIDLDEPLWHNKTVFPLRFLGAEKVRHLKTLCRTLNQRLNPTSGEHAML
jgi:hypothetical protein